MFEDQDVLGSAANDGETDAPRDFFIYPPTLSDNTVPIREGEEPFQPLLTDYLPPAPASLHIIAARLELEMESDDTARSILRCLTHPSYVAPTADFIAPTAPASVLQRQANEITITESQVSMTPFSESKTTRASSPKTDKELAALWDANAPVPLTDRNKAEIYHRLLRDNLLDIGHNAQLAATGKGILGFVLSEYIGKKYPNLPTGTLRLAMDALSGYQAMKDVGSDLGFGPNGIKVRYAGIQNEHLAMVTSVQAVIGLLYEQKVRNWQENEGGVGKGRREGGKAGGNRNDELSTYVVCLSADYQISPLSMHHVLFL